MQEIGTKVISYPEFLAAAADDKLYDQEGIAEQTFHVIDTNADGFIKYDEVQQLLHTSGFEITFDADYTAVDLQDFKKGLIGNFRVLGLTEQESQTLSITLRQGSIVATVSGPYPIIEKLKQMLRNGVSVSAIGLGKSNSHLGRLTRMFLENGGGPSGGALYTPNGPNEVMEIQEAIKKFDTNHDSMIDFPEFKLMIATRWGASKSVESQGPPVVGTSTKYGEPGYLPGTSTELGEREKQLVEGNANPMLEGQEGVQWRDESATAVSHRGYNGGDLHGPEGPEGGEALEVGDFVGQLGNGGGSATR
jgi:Ca2+-binding EF-hand superfamily protein